MNQFEENSTSNLRSTHPADIPMAQGHSVIVIDSISACPNAMSAGSRRECALRYERTSVKVLDAETSTNVPATCEFAVSATGPPVRLSIFNICSHSEPWRANYLQSVGCAELRVEKRLQRCPVYISPTQSSDDSHVDQARLLVLSFVDQAGDDQWSVLDVKQAQLCGTRRLG